MYVYRTLADASAAQKRVLGPLGMNSSSYEPLDVGAGN